MKFLFLCQLLISFVFSMEVSHVTSVKEAMSVLDKSVGYYYKLPLKFQNDKSVLLYALDRNSYTLWSDKLDESFRNDKDIAIGFLKNAYFSLGSFGASIRDDDMIVLEAVKRDASDLAKASKRLQNNREIVLAAVSKNGYALYEANKRFMKDKEVVLTAIAHMDKRYTYYLTRISKNLFKDKDFVLKVSKLNPSFAVRTDASLLDEKSFVLTLLHNNVDIHENISKTLLDDRKVAEVMILKRATNYQYLSPRLKKDERIIWMTLENCKDFQFKEIALQLSDTLRNRATIAKYLLENNGNIMRYMSKETRSNLTLARLVLKKNPSAFKYLSKTLQNNTVFVKECLQLDPDIVKYLPYQFRNNQTIIKELMVKDPLLFLYASSKLQKDKELLDIVAQNKSVSLLLNANEIKHIFKPDVWKEYSFSNVIDLLYGENVVLHRATDIEFTQTLMKRIRIHIPIKVKSMALLQDELGQKSLIALFYPLSEVKEYKFQLNKNDCSYPRPKLKLLFEDENGTVYIQDMSYSGGNMVCEEDESCDLEIISKPYHLEYKKLSFTPRLRIKAKVSKSYTNLRCRISYDAVDYIVSQRKKQAVNFLTHLKFKHDNKSILDIYTSQYMKSNGFYDLKLLDIAKGEILSLEITNIQGEKKQMSTTVR